MKNTIAASASYFFLFLAYAVCISCEISALRDHLIGESKMGMILFTAFGFLMVTIFFLIALTFKLEDRVKWFIIGSYLVAVLLSVYFYKSLLYNATLVIYAPL